jgi:hypothetical protein
MVTEEDMIEDFCEEPQKIHCNYCNKITTHIDTGRSLWLRTCVVCDGKNLK